MTLLLIIALFLGIQLLLLPRIETRKATHFPNKIKTPSRSFFFYVLQKSIKQTKISSRTQSKAHIPIQNFQSSPIRGTSKILGISQLFSLYLFLKAVRLKRTRQTNPSSQIPISITMRKNPKE